MDKSMLLGIVLGVGGATAGGALASYAVFNNSAASTQATAPAVASAPALAPAPLLPQPQYAEVVAVDKVTHSVKTPERQCHQHTVVRRRPVQDEHRIAGTVIGGALGGALGNQIGKGSGRDAARVAGIIAGGYAGNRVQKSLQDGDTYTTTEQRCKTVTHTRSKTIGYDVTYRWNGALNTVRMKSRPADRLPVENGQVVLTSAARQLAYD